MEVTDSVRVEIYRSFIEDGSPPSFEELAENVGIPEAGVRDALRELDAKDVIALEKGRLWLAHPFCAGPCAFSVISGADKWDAICVWDALGILALLQKDGRVETTCPDCDEALEIEINDGAVSGPRSAVIHFGVPASQWYDDIAYT
jgi:hypothetical protein